ncbi:MAG TPA: DUF805 domain-containing protein [Allosphingosinicella sp.]|jgi:uncharacterized membrane protein YhaH (DUF805 family)
MALREHFENAPLLWRTVRGTFDFAGRSRRTELVWWCLGFFVANLVFQTVAADRLPLRTVFLATDALALLFLLPLFALFVRRVHDHSRSGCWVLLLVALVALHLYDAVTDVSFYSHGFVSQRPLPGPLLGLGFLLVFAIFALMAAPETVGPNLYGPDLREGA